MPGDTSTLDGLELAARRPPVLRVARALPPGHAAGWAAEHRAPLTAALRDHGAVLVRGLGIAEPADVAAVARELGGELVRPDREAFARRTALGRGAHSSLEWPPDQPMCMHHELSYALEAPRLLAIGCLTAPATGGVTGLADAEAVLAALPAEITDRFGARGWLLLRSYQELVGVPWQEAFGTADRDEVLAYCAANDISADWRPGGGLRTSQHRPAIVKHPDTGRPCWFNQVAFLNEHTMDPAVRDYMVVEFGPHGLPFTTRHGDGDPIDPRTIAVINDVYEAATVREPWRTGDLLLVDNIRTAHSREPYTGRREIALAMSGPVRPRTEES